MEAILESGDFLEGKGFFQSFIRRVEYAENDVGIECTVSVNLGGELTGTTEVLNTEMLWTPASPLLLREDPMGDLSSHQAPGVGARLKPKR